MTWCDNTKKKWFKDFHIFQFTMAWFNNAMIKWFKDSHIFYFTMTWFDNAMKMWFKDSQIFQYNMTWFDNSMKSDSNFLHYSKFHETNNNTKKKWLAERLRPHFVLIVIYHVVI